MIVDAQVHLWKAETPDWPWMPGRKAQLPEPFTIEKLVPLMDEAGVDRAVIVPPSWPGDRNDYGLEAARRYPNRFAVMGRIPVPNQVGGARLRWKEQPGMLGCGSPCMARRRRCWTARIGSGRRPRGGLPVMFLRRATCASSADRGPPPDFADNGYIDSRDSLEGRIKEAIDECSSPEVSTCRSSCRRHRLIPCLYPWRHDRPHRALLRFWSQRSYWGMTSPMRSTNRPTGSASTHFTEAQIPLEEDKEW